MEAFAIYLLKSASWLTGFALIYYAFLRNERFFPLIRLYLVTGIMVSVFFPLITLHYKVEIPVTQGVSLQETGNTLTEPGTIFQQTQVQKPFNSALLLFSIYAAGVFLFFLRLILQASKLYKAARKAEINREGNAKLVRASVFPESFSFFNYVFINPSVSETETREILNHELVHIHQKHWFDLLLSELLCLLQWANPVAWIYTRFIRLNHEFLADQVALQRTSDPAVYRATLVNQMFSTQVFSLSNSFHYSLNQKRFEMMKNMISSPYRKLKVFLVLPVFAAIFYAFATPEYNYTSPANAAASEEQEVVKAKQENVKDLVNSRFDQSKAKPLIMVDGSVFTGDINKIPSEDIESFSVLADNSATAVFGDKGKNGVVVISTKSKMVNIPAQANLQSVVKGIVLNTDGKPIEGAQITCTGTPGYASGAKTGPDGKFTITEAQNDAYLIIGARGYKSMSVKAEFNIIMTIKLGKDPDFKESMPSSMQRPLLVVDGEITDEAKFQDLGNKGEYGNIKTLTGKEATDKYGEKGKNGVMEAMTFKKAKELGIVIPFRRRNPEDFPTFQGGKPMSFQSWVSKNVKYPAIAIQNGIKGRVYVNFTVEADGSLSNVVVTGAPDPSLADAVLNTVKSAPKWEPAKNPEGRTPYQGTLAVFFELPDKVIEDNAYVVVEKMPSFPGGDAELIKYILNNIKYPEECKKENIQGRVILKFVINTEGKTEDVVVLKKVHPLLDAEAVRIIKSLPPFIPASMGGVPRSVYYNVPVTFSLGNMEQGQIFSKTSMQELLKFIYSDIVYPTAAKNAADSGRVYVVVKMKKGGIAESTAFTEKPDLKVPFLDEVVITAFGSSNAQVTPDKAAPKEHQLLKTECIRVANRMGTLQLPEFKEKDMEFGLVFNFQLR